MSATSSLSAAAATTTSCGATTYNIPTKDAACALPAGGNHTAVLSACCGDTDVVSYYDGCGLYCLAAGQTVADLTQCLFAHGAAYADVFCNTQGNATATATGAALPTSAGASVVATGTSGSATSSSTSDATDSPGAAAGLRPELGSVSTLGLTIGALLFSATAFGAFQL